MGIVRGRRSEGSHAATSATDPHSDSAPELSELANRAREGDESATNELVAHVHRMATRYASARLSTYSSPRERVADVAQEVSLAVYQSLPRYEDRGAPFEAFVYRICAFKVADSQRSASRSDVPSNEIPDSVDEASTPEEVAVSNDTARRLAVLMEQLNDSQREILTLRIGVGLSAEETASWLGMTPGAVRVAQHRALAKLRTLHHKSGEELR